MARQPRGFRERGRKKEGGMEGGKFNPKLSGKRLLSGSPSALLKMSSI